MLERGFEERKIMNVVNGNNETFDVNIPFVRDAILYYTIQQYFNNNDKYKHLPFDISPLPIHNQTLHSIHYQHKSELWTFL